jgi:ABC-type transport system substrate-binding protein
MLRFFSTLEKVLIVLLLLVAVSSGWYLWQRYITDHSELIASEGGLYTEGAVGRPQLINPVFLTGNPVDRDLSQLIFTGLTRYNPHTGIIEDDIATSEKSKDNLSYTFTILPDAKWHDGTAVTADDVLFTYEKVIKDPNFKNIALRQVFSEVSLQKIDDKTVVFKLSEPYSFFLANVSIGLLPKHLLEILPVESLDKSDFNQNPVGSGPYQFLSWTVADQTHEITLKKFDGYYGPLPKISTVIVRAFPDQPAILTAENTLNGFRLTQDRQEPLSIPDRFQALTYRLPQYSALFLNTESPMLSNKKVRFALLLATNKQEILEDGQGAEIVDTPILESKADLDIEYSLERARGAFFDTEWQLPEKVKKLGQNMGVSDGTGGPIDPKVIDLAPELAFRVSSTSDSWISITLDGVAKPSLLLSKGDSKEYTVKKSLVFRVIGNAGGIAVEVNGLKLKSFGTEGQVIRNLLLDRKTLGAYLQEVQPSSGEIPATPPSSEPPTEPVSEISEVITHEPENIPETETDSGNPEPDDELNQVRINIKGERLILRLITAQEPESFLKTAEIVQSQWLEAGAKVVIETYSLTDLQDKIKKRDYDVLLFGQNLGYNLDAFPFWHSSQAKDGLNLSNYHSLEADNLLVDIRKTFDERTKQVTLDKLKKVIAEDTPAIFLSSPTQYYLVDHAVKNVDLGKLSSHADRFTDLLNWYVREDHRLKEGFSFSGLLSWLFGY